jgi:ribosomal-protein-alanine N-acetyltransferase
VCPTVTLRSDRLELRRLDERDAGFVESLYADARVTRALLRIQGPISREQARDICCDPANASGEHRFGAVLAADGRLIALGIVRQRAERPDEATIGYSVLPAFWGQGLGTELAALLVTFATATLGVSEVRATTLEDHHASARILQKLGFAVHEAGVAEIDSRGDERRVTRWVLHTP